MQTEPDAAARQAPRKAVPVIAATGPERCEGGLWRNDSHLGDLFSDMKARREGDIVTIRIMESSEASNSANTQTGRSSSLLAGIDGFFGMEDRYTPDSSYYKQSSSPFNPFSKVEGSMDSDFEGSGTTSRSNDLNAYITARVVEELPNGSLRIIGSRAVEINHEIQLMTLTGIIRPRDISADNVILSTYIADARISYSGTGVLNDRQSPGWLGRTLDHVWPF
jgi:flagellar L-ring protein precursor FlgH